METTVALVGAVAADSGAANGPGPYRRRLQPGPAIGEELRRQRSSSRPPSKRIWLLLVMALCLVFGQRTLLLIDVPVLSSAGSSLCRRVSVYLPSMLAWQRDPSPGVLLPALDLGASSRRKPCRPEPGVLDLSGLMASLLMVDGVVVMSFVTPMAFSRNFLVLVPEMFPVLAVQFCALILHRFSRG